MQVLRQLPQVRDPNLLVGAATADDAGVYRIDPDRALVQTVDFFTPIVDDPFVYGQIAAANALSDVYAMGGRPLTAMNLLGVPTDVVPLKVINTILRGGAAKVKEAKCVLVGHSFGGTNIRVYSGLFPTDVAGMVLVDAAHDDDEREDTCAHRRPLFVAPEVGQRSLDLACAHAVGLPGPDRAHGN